MNIQLFKSDFGAVRVLQDEKGEPWFVAKDVAEMLGYRRAIDMARNLDEDEVQKMHLTDETGRSQEMIIINESGLYSAILRSNKPEAKKFKRWVTSEVLPSIRKHGVYAKDELLNNPDLFIEALQELKKEREARLKAQKELQENKPYISFAKSVEQSVNSILIREWVKAISKEHNITIGEKRAFKWLRDNKYLMKNNEPYQRWIDKGYFERVARTVATTKGTREVFTTLITGKGQIKLGEKILKDFQSHKEGVA